MHLLASEERKILHELVDRMISFGLRYLQTACEAGYAYRLDPPLVGLLPTTLRHNTLLPCAEDVVDAKPPRELPAAVRHLLGVEVQREVMRRHHAHHVFNGQEAGGGQASPAGESSACDSLDPASSQVPELRQRRTALKPVPKPLADKAKMEAVAPTN